MARANSEKDVREQADPSHPDHRKPIWSTGDVGRLLEVPGSTVRDWVRLGVLVPTKTIRGPGAGRVGSPGPAPAARNAPRFAPADLVPQLDRLWWPKRAARRPRMAG